MLTIPAAPPSVPLPKVEAIVVNYLRAHRFTVPDGLTVTVAPLASIASGSLAGTTPLAEAGPGQITASPVLEQWPFGYQLATLLHETLHETPTGGSYQYQNFTDTLTLANEQATESMAQDILPALLRSQGIAPKTVVAWAYTGLVRRERVVSAQSCRCSWKSPAARAWRAAYFFTNPMDRELIN